MSYGHVAGAADIGLPPNAAPLTKDEIAGLIDCVKGALQLTYGKEAKSVPLTRAEAALNLMQLALKVVLALPRRPFLFPLPGWGGRYLRINRPPPSRGHAYACHPRPAEAPVKRRAVGCSYLRGPAVRLERLFAAGPR